MYVYYIYICLLAGWQVAHASDTFSEFISFDKINYFIIYKSLFYV